MGSIYYQHLIKTNDVYSEIEALDISTLKKTQLIYSMENLLHWSVLNLILFYLPEADHKYYLELVYQDPNDPVILDFLKQHSMNIEHKIISLCDEIKYETISLIRQIYV